MSDYSLEIHHMDVRGGDSTAIIVKDLEQDQAIGGKVIYSMLIDAGAEGKGSANLKSYLEKHRMQKFDCIVATHYHQDHIQGFPAASIKFDKFLDNGAYPHREGDTYEVKNHIGSESATYIFDAYKAQVQKQVKNGATRVPIPFIEKNFKGEANPVSLELVPGSGINLTCYCANGILANGANVLAEQQKGKNRAVSPNDISLALVLEWGDFLYFTAGDLSGDSNLTSYYNIEEKLVKYLISGPLKDKRISVFKASHHGSEHSNQLHLLNSLNPETIIVSCNIMKQVPSPVFLTRLQSYFDTNKNPFSVAAFTNTMKIFKNDDRYEPLQNIKAFIAEGNVAFKTENEEIFASNLGIKCAIIRRRMHNNIQKDFVDDNMPPETKIIKRPGYDIVLIPRNEEEEKEIGASIRFLGYKMNYSFFENECSFDEILKGFRNQAKEVVRWLKSDREKKQQVGLDYIKEHYPGLVATIDRSEVDKLEENLVNQMQELFNETFTLKPSPSGDIYAVKGQSQLTSDQKKTIYLLLIDNYYQDTLNVAIKFKNARRGKLDYFDPLLTWNFHSYQEPYYEPTAGGGGKRTMENPRLPPAKRNKSD